MATKNKEKVISFRLSEKNEIYFKKMGFLTPGRAKVSEPIKLVKNDDSINLSKFLNDLITFHLESEKHRFANLVTREDLLLAYWERQKYCIAREYDDLNERMRFAKHKCSEAERLLIDRKAEKALQ